MLAVRCDWRWCTPSCAIVAAAALAFACKSPFDDAGPPAPDRPFADPELEPLTRTLVQMQEAGGASAAGATGDSSGADAAARASSSSDVADPSALPVVPAAPEIDSARAYTLAELIDIAQRNNPTTRAVWERARMAALAIGLVDGAYQPMLAASVTAGYERAVFPIPAIPPLTTDTYFTAQTADVVPGLQLNWLLYDFGRREAAEAAAQQNALAVSATFNEQHQRVAQAVTDAYHTYLTAIDRAQTMRTAALAARDV
ncbi:MAG: TolC family protein, partial [Phycisphaerales bacterium]|nr:TolC family protein [Phycisphaerales bacterium]